jgi:hypothetical protein
MPPVGLEPAILLNVRPQTHALDRTANRVGRYTNYEYTFEEQKIC